MDELFKEAITEQENLCKAQDNAEKYVAWKQKYYNCQNGCSICIFKSSCKIFMDISIWFDKIK